MKRPPYQFPEYQYLPTTTHNIFKYGNKTCKKPSRKILGDNKQNSYFLKFINYIYKLEKKT